MQPTQRIDNIPMPEPIHAQPKQAQPKCSMKTGPAVVKSAHIAAGSAYFLAHPDCSLFIPGMKMMFGKTDFFGPIGTILGGLMILASPMWGIVRVVGGGGGVIVGGVATAATGIAYAGEAAAKGIAQMAAPSEATQQRKELTRRFVNRMNDTINNVPYGDRVYFREHITDLINISVLEVAFLSRTVKDNDVILVNNERFGYQNIANQDETRRSYFNDICEMKMAIQSLNLSPNDDHGWKILKQDMCEWTPENEEKKFSEVDHETLSLLWATMHSFSQKLRNDEVFNSVWREANARQ